MLKNLLKILSIFFLGVFGGIFGNQFFEHYFLKRQILNNSSPPAPVFVTQTKEIKIQENVALREAIEKVEKAIVGVKTETQKGKTLKGSGIILTSDGLILTLADLVPQGGKFSFFVEGQKVYYQVLKRDLKENLALIKIEKENLKTVPFADFEKLKLGERVFLVGTAFREKEIGKEVNEGIIKYFNQDLIETNIFEKENLAGSGLFDIEGRLLGINKVDPTKKIISIPVTKIRSFTGL